MKVLVEWLIDLRELQYEFANTLYRTGRITMIDEIIERLSVTQKHTEEKPT